MDQINNWFNLNQNDLIEITKEVELLIDLKNQNNKLSSYEYERLKKKTLEYCYLDKVASIVYKKKNGINFKMHFKYCLSGCKCKFK